MTTVDPKPRVSGLRGKLNIFELQDGNFAIVGTDRTAELSGQLPEDAGVAPYEKIVVITRDTFLAAAKDLPH